MKKLIALLLAAVMCVCLAACGGADAPNKNDEGEKQQENQSMDNNHPFFQFLYGEWEYTGNFPDSFPFTKLSVNEDGTCIVDGVAGTWAVSKSTSPNGRLYIDVCVDGQEIGGAEIYVWAGKYKFNVSDTAINPGDNWKHNTAVVADDNDIVLTAENWQNYFDLITENNYSENAFGEVEHLTIRQYLVPKEEYADKILATDVVYEMGRTANEYFIYLNAAEKTYDLGEMVQIGEPSTPEIQELWCVYETGRYEMHVTTNHIEAKDHADPDSTSNKKVWLVTDIENINMVRIQGNLYIINE